LKSTETPHSREDSMLVANFSNFGSLKSTETERCVRRAPARRWISAISAR